MTNPLPKKQYQEQIKGLFDIERFKEWKAKVNDERRMLNGFEHKYQNYLLYLSSDDWKAKRQVALERDGYICQHCKAKPAEQVHHLTYNRLYNESIDDLLSLCSECHLKVHALIEP